MAEASSATTNGRAQAMSRAFVVAELASAMSPPHTFISLFPLGTGLYTEFVHANILFSSSSIVMLCLISEGSIMLKNIPRLYCWGLFALTLALLLVLSPLTVHGSYASASNASASNASVSAPWTGVTTTWANVRLGPGTNYTHVATYPAGKTVTVYASVSGQATWGNNSTWYRISKLNLLPWYIYSGLVTPSSRGTGGGPVPPPSAHGKEILISISRQWMYVYQDGKLVYNSPITTGRPELPTPTGLYHVLVKLHPTTFYSPWPAGSPYWYPPTHINYALEWSTIGLFLHDSWWRTVYGPGTNVWHYDPVYGRQTGTHGCITMPLRSAIWLYNWAPIGTPVKIQK